MECVGFTKSYASPELLASFELEDFSNLRPDKIDSFALGCILYELLMLQRLEHVSSEQTLAEFITDGAGLDSAMNTLPLPFLPPDVEKSNVVGYTNGLKSLVMNLLKPNVAERWLPGQLQQPLRHDPKSPLVTPHVTAAQTAVSGALVTVDNIQLGMFVQRGPDWDDGESDGPIGSVGVIVRLDADALYAEVAFPSRLSNKSPEPICCRIGASNKFELQVGPVSLPDFVSNQNYLRHDGIVPVDNTDAITLGQKLNDKCEIVGVDKSLGVVMVAPLEMFPLKPSLSKPKIWQIGQSSFVSPRQPVSHPSSWNLSLGSFTHLLEQEEMEKVMSLFFGTMDLPDHLRKAYFPVEKVERVQDEWLFESYARRKEKVALENWGLENELDAFMACTEWQNKSDLQNFQSSGQEFSTKALRILGRTASRSSSTNQILLCRVVTGRVASAAVSSSKKLICHTECIGGDVYRCRGTCLAYPQYIITYTNKAPSGFNYGVSADATNDANQSNSERSPTKECVVCMENPVKYVMVPCGHAALCDRCNRPRQLRKLKGKCPECRQAFQRTMMLYGRVVNDE